MKIELSDSESIKRVQKMSAEMLCELYELFSRYGLSCVISYGTALGAVRHGGFIPWDDDIDVDMPAKDLRKLMKIWRKIPHEGYFLQNVWTDPHVPGLYWRIRKNGTTSMDKQGLKIPMHWGLPLDIFAVYNAPRSLLLKKLMLKLYIYAEQLSFDGFYEWDIAKGKDTALRNPKCRLCNRLLFLMSDLFRNSKEVFYPEAYLNRTVSNCFFKKDIFYPLTDISFEGKSFKGYHRADEYLKQMYGDYMTLPPPEKRCAHDTFILDLEKDFSEYVEYDCTRFR